MQIEAKDIQVGTQVLFDGGGFLFNVLSFALSVFDSDWRKIKVKPWHVGFISRYDQEKGWMLCESMAGGIVENPLSIYPSKDYYRLYQWFKTPPSNEQVSAYLKDHLGCHYDGLVYIWTIIASIIDKVFHINIGVWNNESYMCWENLEEFDEWCNKPLTKKNRTITISDIYKTLNHQE
jgi:hypothetical protein